MNWMFLSSVSEASSTAREAATWVANVELGSALATISSAPPRPIELGANSTPTDCSRRFKAPRLPVVARWNPARRFSGVEPLRVFGSGSPELYPDSRIALSSIRSAAQFPCMSPETKMLLCTRSAASLSPRRWPNSCARSTAKSPQRPARSIPPGKPGITGGTFHGEIQVWLLTMRQTTSRDCEPAISRVSHSYCSRPSNEDSPAGR